MMTHEEAMQSWDTGIALLKQGFTQSNASKCKVGFDLINLVLSVEPPPPVPGPQPPPQSLTSWEDVFDVFDTACKGSIEVLKIPPDNE